MQSDAWKPLYSSGWGYVEWFKYQEMRVFPLYSYPLIDDRANIFTKEGLRCEALRLLEAIETSKSAARGSRLIFVGHDIGGILIKEVCGLVLVIR
jgi:hypothetical protein